MRKYRTRRPRLKHPSALGKEGFLQTPNPDFLHIDSEGEEVGSRGGTPGQDTSAVPEVPDRWGP